MARTFDIRFARSDGIAALLETPANTFRWRGAGSLRIDGGRLDIQQKRGIHTLLTRHTHFRLDAADLRGVAREGHALRIEFGVPGARRGVLPFWVRDRAEAAEIIRLMPTDRTVESDEPAANPAPRRRHPPGVLIAVALVSLIVGVIGASILGNGRTDDMRGRSQESAGSSAVGSRAPETADASGLESRAIRVPAHSVAEPARALPASRSSTASTTSTASPDVPPWQEQEAMPVESSTSALGPGDTATATTVQMTYVDADAEIWRFMREALALRSDYVYGQSSPGGLESRWWELSVRLYNSPAFDSRPRNILVDTELGLSLNWRASLANYRDALGSGDVERIESARADLERASELTDEIARFVR
jgi:hypothetical protein